MSVEKIMAGEGNRSPEGATGGVAVAEKPTEASVLISPEAKTPGTTTTKVQELVKPSVNIWRRFLPGSGAQTPEEVVVEEEEITPVSESEPAAGGVGNGSEGRGGNGGGGGGRNGPERLGGPGGGGPEWWKPEGIDDNEWRGLEPDDKATLAITHIENLTFEDRDLPENLDRYEQAKKVLRFYAEKDKIAKLTVAMVKEEERLVDFDNREIEGYEESDQQVDLNEFQEELTSYLYLLDRSEKERSRQEEFQQWLLNTGDGINPVSIPSVFKKSWDDTSDKLAGAIRNVNTARANITQRTQAGNPGFLVGRDNLKREIEANIAILKRELKEAEKERDERELWGEQEEWERDQEIRRIREKVQSLNLSPETLPDFAKSYSQLKEFITNQEEYKQLSHPRYREQALESAYQIKEWYFWQARELGMFNDLDSKAASKFQELARRILETQSIPLSVEEALTDEEIAKYADLVEKNSWSNRNMQRLTSEERERFAGIRRDIFYRAFEKVRGSVVDMAEKLSDIQRGLRAGASLSDAMREAEWQIQPDAVALLGEIDILGLDRNIRETYAREKESDLLYVDHQQLGIELTGRTRREIEIGANNFINSVIQTATSIDLGTIQNKLRFLESAILSKADVLRISERITETKAREILSEINLSVQVKGALYILNELADNIQMAEYSSFFEQTVMRGGYGKLQEIMTMESGKVAYAIYLLQLPQFRILYMPEGFKGQMANDRITQDYLRNKIFDQILNQLMQFELMAGKDKDDLLRAGSMENFAKLFEKIKNPTDTLKVARVAFEDVNKRQDQALIQSARRELTIARSKYEESRRRATSALDTAKRVLNVFGEAAYLGPPTIKMDNGDQIGTQDLILAHTFIFKEVMKKSVAKYEQQLGVDFEDNYLAIVRWRGYQWTRNFQWKENSQEEDSVVKAEVEKKDGGMTTVSFKLKEGFEEFGWTEEEWGEYQYYVDIIREQGFNAVIFGQKFGDIIKQDELKPVLNNFFAVYESAKDTVSNPEVARDAARGDQPWVFKFLKRLGLDWNGALIGEAPEERKDDLTQLIANSTFLHDMCEDLVYYQGIRIPKTREENGELVNIKDPGGNIIYDDHFTTYRVRYGYQGLSWGIKRLQYLRAHQLTNSRAMIGRWLDGVPFLPARLYSLSQESGFDNFLEMVWNLNKEGVDNYTLMTFAYRNKNALNMMITTQSSIDDKGEMNWRFWDKPTVDIATLWVGIRTFLQDKPKTKVKEYIKNPKLFNSILYIDKVKLINEIIMKVLGRAEPPMTAADKTLAQDRMAGGAGLAVEQTDKFMLRFWKRWLLTKRAGDRRGQGGLTANESEEEAIKFITAEGSYNGEISLFDEGWRKVRSSRDPGLPVPWPILKAA